MIVRPAGGTLHLITQPAHAALARRIMEPWATGGLADHPRRDSILHAIEQHDNGWTEVDASPMRLADGRIADFITLPMDARRGVWPRGVNRLADDPFAAALVAEHSIVIFDRFRADVDWAPFFAAQAVLRAKYAAAAAVSLEDLHRDYAFLRLADLISLTFCNGWTEAQDAFGHHIAGDGGEIVVVSPDPFGAVSVSLEVEARLLPNRVYRDDADLAAAWHDAPTTTLTGVCRGGA
ncbi:MAG TPA: DUF3891 family protein [Vicinamibacterales bacterium]|nr:DUF3891 family protein [Vicinamibacterales bacterium]